MLLINIWVTNLETKGKDTEIIKKYRRFSLLYVNNNYLNDINRDV